MKDLFWAPACSDSEIRIATRGLCRNGWAANIASCAWPDICAAVNYRWMMHGAGIPPGSVARFQSRRNRNYSLPVCGVFFSIHSIRWRAHVSRRISSIFTFGTTYVRAILNPCIRHDGYYFIFIPLPLLCPITSRIRAILFLTGFSLLFFLYKKIRHLKDRFFSLYMHTNWTRIFV